MVQEILSSLGYELADKGTEFRTKALYREGDNPSSLKIDKSDGRFIDFVTGTKGSFSDLIALTLGVSSFEALDLLKSKYRFTPVRIEPKAELKQPKFFAPEFLQELIPDHSYWIGRGISESVVSQFRGGVDKGGRMKDRYVFPIFDVNNRIVGVSGRDLTGRSDAKWKHCGEKSTWTYPVFLTPSEIGAQIIIVESIGDMLSLFEVGIKNVIVAFGIELGKGILTFLLKHTWTKNIIALNNDGKGFAGNIGAQKMKKKLLNYFDERKVDIRLPGRKDLNDMLINDRESLRMYA